MIIAINISRHVLYMPRFGVHVTALHIHLFQFTCKDNYFNVVKDIDWRQIKKNRYCLIFLQNMFCHILSPVI